MIIRKAHVKRIKQTDDDGNVNDDVWIDVMRIDKFQTKLHDGAQDIIINLKWKYDDDGKDVENTLRKLRKAKVYNPDDDASFVTVPVIDRLFINDPAAQNQGFYWNFKNGRSDEKVANRTVKVKRVKHVDLSDDIDMNAGQPIDFAEYLAAMGEDKDEDQFVDAELITKFRVVTHDGAQGMTSTMNNKFIDEMQDNAPGDEDPPEDPEKGPARLDPFQTIMNVSWGGVTEVEEQSTMDADIGTAVEDTDQMIISMWVRAPAPIEPIGLYPLLEWGAISHVMLSFGHESSTGSHGTVIQGDRSFKGEQASSRICIAPVSSELGQAEVTVKFSSPRMDPTYWTCGFDPDGTDHTYTLTTSAATPAIGGVIPQNCLRFGKDALPEWWGEPNQKIFIDSIPLAFFGQPQCVSIGWVEQSSVDATKDDSRPLKIGDVLMNDVCVVNVPAGTVVRFVVTREPFAQDGSMAGVYPVKTQLQLEYDTQGVTESGLGFMWKVWGKAAQSLKKFRYDLWNHILITLDLSKKVNMTPGPYLFVPIDAPSGEPFGAQGPNTVNEMPRIYMCLNNEDYSSDSFRYPAQGQSAGGVPNGNTGLDYQWEVPTPRGGVLPQWSVASLGGTSWLDGLTGAVGDMSFIWDGRRTDAYPNTIDCHVTSASVPIPPDWHNTEMIVAPWKCALGDGKLGVPFFRDNFSPPPLEGSVGSDGTISDPNNLTGMYFYINGQNQVIEYARVEIWTKRTADTEDIKKYFVAPFDPDKDDPALLEKSVNGIKMLATSVAEDALGPPEFRFQGAPSSFVKNRGSTKEILEELLVYGDIESYSPGPPTGSPPTT